MICIKLEQWQSDSGTQLATVILASFYCYVTCGGYNTQTLNNTSDSNSNSNSDSDSKSIVITGQSLKTPTKKPITCDVELSCQLCVVSSPVHINDDAVTHHDDHSQLQLLFVVG